MARKTAFSKTKGLAMTGDRRGLGGLAQRHRCDELMDQTDLSVPLHIQALGGLERINWVSRSARVYWPLIRARMKEETNKPLRILDIACGAGDNPIRLWKKCQQAGVSVQIDGCDRSPRALEFARQRAKENGADVGFFKLDIDRDPIPEGYDILLSSLFLHHLEEKQAVCLLQQMMAATSSLVMVQDLIRNRIGLFLSYLASRTLSTSRVIYTDAPLSVRGAFTVEETMQLAQAASMNEVEITRHWPCRFLLVWKRR